MSSDEQPPRRRSRDLIDQSRLRQKRAQRKIARSQERIKRTEHRWMRIALGRVCEVCKRVEAKGEFEDGTNCPGKTAV